MPNDVAFTLRSWPTAIMHLDGDAFFASCEQSIHPELAGRPVITGQERNIVASMSYEAKALGITRGTPLWEAKKICPSVIILPSDYETYSLISKKMFSIMRRFTPVVEESSIDEGYAELAGLRRVYRMSYPLIAQHIQETVQKELGLSVSVGLSLNKTLSKLAAKFRKPHGFTAVKGSHIHLFLARIQVGEICGIGPNSKALLNKYGILTALDYAKHPRPHIKGLLGKIGVELWDELHGDYVYALNTEEKKSYYSVMKTKTFTPPSDDYNYVKAQLFRNIESAFIKIRRFKLRAKGFYIFLKKQDFKSRACESHFSRGVINPAEVFHIIEEALKQIYEPNTLYRSTGVALLKLEEDLGMQFELFEAPVQMIRMKKMAESIDQINREFGKHTVFSGAGLFLKRDKTKPTGAEGRHALAARKTDLLPGETFRQRLQMPVWKIKV
jgi:DNA polymerase-4